MAPKPLRRKRPYSEIVELAAWDFCEDSLQPRPLIRHSTDVHMRHFQNRYWNIFNRVEDKRVTFEIPLMSLEIYDREIDFFDERRLLFQTDAATADGGSVLNINFDVYKAIAPFDAVARGRALGVECHHPNREDWCLGEFPENPRINEELASLLPEQETPIGENVLSRINKISRQTTWTEPVTTEHVVIQDYCEYGYMGAFMNYLVPLVEMGRAALCRHLKQSGMAQIARMLKKKRNYRGWRFWMLIKKALFFDSGVTMNTSLATIDAKHYIKHEVYMTKPRMLTQVFLEEHNLDGLS